jgi:hypothetical protein
MAETDAAPAIYRALLALKPDELKLGPWAERAGLARNYFNGLKDHGNPRREALDALLGAIGRTQTDLDRLMQPVGAEVAAIPGPATHDMRRTFYGEGDLPPLQLMGTAIGGEFGDLDEDIELTELHLGDVLGYLARPASLAGDIKAYALTIVGDSMSPRFRPGERVGVSPRAPVAIGDDVIVQLRGPEDDGERIKMVLIKELVRRTANYVELRQYNPDMTFRVEAKRVASLHAVRANFF